MGGILVVIRKIIVIFLVIVMLLSLGACGIRKKIDERISEKITEGVVNKITGGEANIDIDNGEVTIKGDDGEEVTFGSNEWPKGKAVDLLPEPKEGKIISVMNSDNVCLVILEEVKEKVYKEYIEELKDKGFEKDVYEYADELGRSYFGSLDENTHVQALYTIEDEMLNISIEINE